MIKIKTKIIKNEEKIDTISVEVNEKKSTVGEYLTVANTMFRIIKERFDMSDEEIYKVISKLN